MTQLVRSLLVLAAGAMGLASASTPSAARQASQARAGSRAAAIFERKLPNVPGKSLVAVEVVYPPGGASPPHRHPTSAFVYAYVVSGSIVSAVDGEPPRTYHAGESFYEAPGAHHRISRNASSTKPAKLLAVFVEDSGSGRLTLPDGG
jgi:quercetin dioxygenase-like cupin family protein